MKILKKRKGGAYIRLMIGLFVIMTALVLIVNVLPIFWTMSKLNHFSESMLRIAETRGSTETDDVYSRLSASTGLSPTASWNASYFSGKRVQLDSVISLTLTTEYSFKVAGFEFKVPLKSSVQGRSERYWK